MKSRLHLLFSALLASAASLAAPAWAQTQAPEKPTDLRSGGPTTALPYTKDQLKYDSEFAVAAASASDLEVALGKLAQQKAIVQEVKDWGKTMEQEHTAAGQRLAAIAARHGIALPKMMSDADRRIYDDVDDRKYLGFDKKYLRDLEELHERTIRRYAEAATKLRNPELLAYATEMLPQLRAHEAQTAELFKRANERK